MNIKNYNMDADVLRVCRYVDDAIAERLAESILQGTSYDMLEAHYGIMPISRNCFYRRRRHTRYSGEREGELRKNRMGR